MHRRGARVIIAALLARVLIAVAWVGVVVDVAAAAPKRKVKITTDPDGATVYLNAKEDGPVCTTPCTIEAPVGDTPIIIELENHQQIIDLLSVPAKKPVTVKFKLERAIGTITVPGPAGARITVDDEDKGKAPATFEVGAGSHNVKLTLNGKQIASEFVEVGANEEIEVAPSRTADAGDDDDGDDDDADDDVTTSDDGGDAAAITTGATPSPRRRGPIIAIAAAIDVGFRNFTYENAQTANLNPEREGGQVLIGPHVEVWPGNALGIHPLRGLALVVRFGYGVNQQQVKQAMTGAPTSAKTFWRAFEASLRQRWVIANKATFEVGGGYVRDQYQFEGDSADIKLVPDADYQAIRLGIRGSLRLGAVEPYLAAENRLVMSGGTLETRFDDASASGLRAALGVALDLGSFYARVEGALNRYTWSFTARDMSDEFRATGGVDSIKLISVAAGYAY